MLFVLADFDVNNYKKNIINKYKKVFSNDMFTTIKHFEAEIILKENVQPIFSKVYSVPYGMLEKVGEELDKLEKFGIIFRVKHSKVASPIVIVKKSSGDIRICVDCSKTINRFMETEHYPLPIIDDIFADLSECRVFCVLDLTGAYQQVAASERSQEWLTVNTHKGLYRFRRLVFGVASAPAIFQEIMDKLLEGMKNVKCYFDDVLIGGSNIVECKKNLELVLERFEEHNVRANLAKCRFFASSIEYLGHVISDGKVKTNEKKCEAILKANAPKNIGQLQSFLGMMNYYSKFIPNLSTELHDLYPLLKKNAHFEWLPKHEQAFQKCKQLLASNNVLILYGPRKEIVISCDASPYGVGCVLSHVIDSVEKPVMFASATLSPAEKNYSQVHREALAVVFSVKKFHKYIYGKKFTIKSDC